MSVIRFALEGKNPDPDVIVIPEHRVPVKRVFKLLRYLGRVGQDRLFRMEERLWADWNDRLYAGIVAEAERRACVEPRLVYCHTPIIASCARQLADRYQCPLVVHHYGTFLYEALGRPRAYLRWAPEYCGWRVPVDLRICNDDGTRGIDVAQELGFPLDKFLFQRHGLDTAEIDAADGSVWDGRLDPTCQYVMSSSRLVRWKRVDRLIRAIPAIVAEMKNVQFIALGEGLERGRLERLAKRLGVEGHLIMPGAVSRAEVFGLMKRAHVFASTNDIGNLSRGLKEAMYAGLCIVTLDTGETRTLITDGENGRLVRSDDTEALAHAIVEVLRNPELRTALGQAGKRTIMSFEPSVEEVLGERMVRLQEVLDPHLLQSSTGTSD